MKRGPKPRPPFQVPGRLEELPPVLMPSEAAAVLKLNRDTIYDLIVAKRLKAASVGLGRRATYRILREDLIAYVRGTERGAAA